MDGSHAPGAKAPVFGGESAKAEALAYLEAEASPPMGSCMTRGQLEHGLDRSRGLVWRSRLVGKAYHLKRDEGYRRYAES